jgi:hypothetical protein
MILDLHKLLDDFGLFKDRKAEAEIDWKVPELDKIITEFPTYQ